MRCALLAAGATGVQVGAALVASEAIVAEVGAGRLGFLRYAVALAFLLPLAARSKALPIPRRDLLAIALIGIGQFGVLIAFLNLAVLYSGAARASLVFATLPLATLGVSWVLGRTRVSKRDVVAIVITVVGAGILVGGDALVGRLGGSDLIGISCAAFATLTGAICSSVYGPYLKGYGVVRVSTLAMAASLVPLGVMALLEHGGHPPAEWGAEIFILVAFVGLSSGVGYLMWLYALAHAPAAIVTAFLALSPITAVSLSALAVGAPLTAPVAVALILIIGGLMVTALPPFSAQRVREINAR